MKNQTPAAVLVVGNYSHPISCDDFLEIEFESESAAAAAEAVISPNYFCFTTLLGFDFLPLRNMNKYHIYTDSASREIEAKNLAEALSEWDEAPKSVKTAEQFETWLERVGGYGGIQENGLQIANVRP